MDNFIKFCLRKWDNTFLSCIHEVKQEAFRSDTCCTGMKNNKPYKTAK